MDRRQVDQAEAADATQRGWDAAQRRAQERWGGLPTDPVLRARALRERAASIRHHAKQEGLARDAEKHEAEARACDETAERLDPLADIEVRAHVAAGEQARGLIGQIGRNVPRRGLFKGRKLVQFDRELAVLRSRAREAAARSGDTGLVELAAVPAAGDGG